VLAFGFGLAAARDGAIADVRFAATTFVSVTTFVAEGVAGGIARRSAAA
jgi:hypothetical protein